MGLMKQGKHVYYSSSVKEDKHFFGGFFNLACDNIASVLDKFASHYYIDNKKTEKKFEYYESILKKCFNKSTSHSDWEKRVFYLKQYFPVIHFLDLPLHHDLLKNEPLVMRDAKKRDLFLEGLIKLIELVYRLRNQYTHYEYNSISEKYYCFELLDRLFVDVCKSVRSKRMKTDKTKQLLKDSLKDELTELFEKKRSALEKKKNEGGRVDLSPDKVMSSVYNDAFKHLLSKDEYKDLKKKPIEKVGYRYVARYSAEIESKTGVMLSENGVLFLLSIFLSKKENEDIRAKVKGFKGKSQLAMMATHWVFSYLSFKGLKQRLGNTYCKETLLVQVIDELSKVPNEVYRNLSQESKEQFLEDMNEYIKEGKVDYSIDEATVIHPIIRKRYQNNFNYFALRYLDEMVDFPSLKFQINLGFYVHDARAKDIDGTQYITERKVKEHFRVFGKLSEVTKLKNDFFIKTELNVDLKKIKWEQYPNPSYNFDNDKTEQHNIPIYIDMSKSVVEGAKRIGEEHKNYQSIIEKEKRGERREITGDECKRS